MGSLTKAGKVRDQVRRQRGLTQTSLPDYYKQQREKRRKTTPRTENRRKFERRALNASRRKEY